MTNEEAIKGLKRLFSESELDLPCMDSLEIEEMAIEALEKQIPMRPIFKNYKLVCPTCGYFLVVGCGCPRNGCGQRILWEEEVSE